MFRSELKLQTKKRLDLVTCGTAPYTTIFSLFFSARTPVHLLTVNSRRKNPLRFNLSALIIADFAIGLFSIFNWILAVCFFRCVKKEAMMITDWLPLVDGLEILLSRDFLEKGEQSFRCVKGWCSDDGINNEKRVLCFASWMLDVISQAAHFCAGDGIRFSMGRWGNYFLIWGKRDFLEVDFGLFIKLAETNKY